MAKKKKRNKKSKQLKEKLFIEKKECISKIAESVVNRYGKDFVNTVTNQVNDLLAEVAKDLGIEKLSLFEDSQKPSVLIEEAVELIEEESKFHEVINVFTDRDNQGNFLVSIDTGKDIKNYSVPKDVYYGQLKKYILGRVRNDDTKLGKVYRLADFYNVIKNVLPKSPEKVSGQLELPFEKE